MNPERLQILKDWLERGAPPEHGIAQFDMETFCDAGPVGCGTCACIGGSTILFFGEAAEKRKLRNTNVALSTLEIIAAKLLGLDAKVADELFYAHDGLGSFSLSLDRVTPAMAAKAIGNVMTTGRPNWEQVSREELK